MYYIAQVHARPWNRIFSKFYTKKLHAKILRNTCPDFALTVGNMLEKWQQNICYPYMATEKHHKSNCYHPVATFLANFIHFHEILNNYRVLDSEIIDLGYQ